MKKISAILALAIIATVSWFAYNHFQVNTNGGLEQKSDESPEGEEAEAREMALYFGAMRNNPTTGAIPLDAYYQARLDAKHYAGLGMRGDLGLVWEEMGPDNQGGRTRAILIDKDNSDLMFAGGVTGGLWKSTNGGSSWTKVQGTDDFNNMNVSCITQAANGNIYFGTGENFGFFQTTNVTGATGFPGGGVWMSSDHGETWSNIKSPDDTNSVLDPWSFVNDIVADGQDPNIVWVAIRGSQNNNRGLQIINPTTNAVTSVASTVLNTNAMVNDIECGSDGSVHISIAGKYYRKAPGQASFTVANTFNSATRVEIAIAPSNPNVLYFIASGANQGLTGVWKTTDGGENFEVIAGSSNPTSSEWVPVTQGGYALASAVHPTNPDVLFIGGLDCYRYTPSLGFVQISNWNYSALSPNYVHADIHNFLFRPDNPNAMYVVSDGGVNYTSNCTAGTVVWSTKNNGYITTQFYSATAKDYTGDMLGGTQDNGNWLIDFNGNTTRWGNMIKGGDGGDVAVSTINPNLLFAEYVDGDLARSSNNGASFGNALDSHIDPDGDNTPDEGAPFITQIELWENPYDGNPLTQAKLFMGTNSNVWMTNEALDLTKTPTWFKLVDNTSYAGGNHLGNPVSALAVSKNGETVYAGTDDGRLFRISGIDQVLTYQDGDFDPGDFGIQVTMVKDFGNGRFITGIDVDDNNDAHVVVTLGNYGEPDHVYEATNATDSLPDFTNIATASSGLPAMPVYACLIDRENPNVIILGTELGVYGTSNGGNTWTIEDDGLPRNPVLKLHQFKLNDVNSPTGSVDNVILAATYGRGLFRTRTMEFTSTEEKPKAQTSQVLDLYPNPASEQTTLTLMLTQKTDLRIDIYSLDGKLVKSSAVENKTTGQAKIDVSTAGLANGSYLVNVTGNGIEATRKLVVLK